MKVITKKQEIKCSVCGNVSYHKIIIKSAAPEAPDLDLRPSEPHRSSMEYWVMECPKCGYCNDYISKAAEFEQEYLQSEEYIKLNGIESNIPLATRFIKKALVNVRNHNLTEAVQSYLYAAWVFDDDKNNTAATECRAAAIKLIDENKDVFEKNDNFTLLKADMLRRCGEFERVINEFSDKKFKTPVLTALSKYHVSLAQKNDSSVHRSIDAPGISVK